MPGILLSMESSDPTSPDATNRRRSGRVKSKPVLLQQDPNVPVISSGGSKRKRPDDAETEAEDEPEEELSSLEESESDPDEEELKEQRRKARKPKAPRSKPTAKKPKTASHTFKSLPMRPATNGLKKPAKPKPKPRPRKAPSRAREIASVEDEEGLYGQVIANSVAILFADVNSGCLYQRQNH